MRTYLVRHGSETSRFSDFCFSAGGGTPQFFQSLLADICRRLLQWAPTSSPRGVCCERWTSCWAAWPWRRQSSPGTLQPNPSEDVGRRRCDWASLSAERHRGNYPPPPQYSPTKPLAALDSSGCLSTLSPFFLFLRLLFASPSPGFDHARERLGYKQFLVEALQGWHWDPLTKLARCCLVACWIPLFALSESPFCCVQLI